jgi:hypothetical protein
VCCSLKTIIVSRGREGYCTCSVQTSAQFLCRESFNDLSSHELITNVTFESPSCVVQIEAWTFCDCLSLKSICIPSSVELLGGVFVRACESALQAFRSNLSSDDI